jgi:DNA-directed RNA polymerase specialized sigma24 family protein
MDTLDLPLEMRQVLAELELLSHGSTQSFAAAPGAGSDKSYGRPPGDEHPPHLHWRNQWKRASDEDRRSEVLRHAKADLAAHRKGDMSRVQVMVESRDELEKRVVREGKGWSVQETALHCRVTPTFVRKARLRAAADAAVDAQDELATVPVDKRERCLHLAAGGHTERGIAMLTKLPKSTVRRLIGRAA